ncbi:unnamed protein product [Cuscuta epithymum]|uniref:RRM domain-containing protein n=1 Tax=Cuscuta epithymum TaxID=186058 RepID=A0AAV0GI52_9ASTE|nr:unnamed protein product [Cuscuta epithymum]
MAPGAEISGETTLVKAPAVENSSPLTNSSAGSNKVSDSGSDHSTNVKFETTGDKESDCDTHSNSNSNSGYEMQDIVDMLKTLKLNPHAREFFPSSYNRELRMANHFRANNRRQSHGFPNNRRRRNNNNNGRKRMNSRGFNAQREDSIKRTVYVTDIDQNITEEQLAALFSAYGRVVDCRICGDPHSRLRFAFVEFYHEYSARGALNISGTILGFSPLNVLPSKTAILPVNPTFLPRSEDEREMCARTVYCTNIDKKLTQADVKYFFETRCGAISRIRLLGDQVHSTRIAFVEFVMAESAIIALDCCGEILGSQGISKERIHLSSSSCDVKIQYSVYHTPYLIYYNRLYTF